MDHTVKKHFGKRKWLQKKGWVHETKEVSCCCYWRWEWLPNCWQWRHSCYSACHWTTPSFGKLWTVVSEDSGFQTTNTVKMGN